MNHNLNIAIFFEKFQAVRLSRNEFRPKCIYFKVLLNPDEMHEIAMDELEFLQQIEQLCAEKGENFKIEMMKPTFPSNNHQQNSEPNFFFKQYLFSIKQLTSFFYSYYTVF